MRFIVATLITACVPSYEKDFARIDKRLESMETHVARSEHDAYAASTAASTAASSAALAVEEAHAASNACKSTPAPKPAPAWSCAANCIKSYNCVGSGTSNVKWKSLTSSGPSAAEAFEKLQDQCSDEMYIDGRCVDGKWSRVAATIVNACVRN